MMAKETNDNTMNDNAPLSSMAAIRGTKNVEFRKRRIDECSPSKFRASEQILVRIWVA